MFSSCLIALSKKVGLKGYGHPMSSYGGILLALATKAFCHFFISLTLQWNVTNTHLNMGKMGKTSVSVTKDKSLDFISYVQ